MNDSETPAIPASQPPAALSENERPQSKQTALQKIRAFLLGYDLFISYRRADANDYALRLTNQLMKLGFRCYLDQFSSHTDPNLPEEVKQALRRSRGMVVVASPKAMESSAIAEEVAIFSTLKRTMLPIDVARTLRDDSWDNRIAGLSRADESIEALEKGRPSRLVLTRLNDSVDFRKRNDQLKRTFLTTLASIALLLVAGGVTVGYFARQGVAARNQAAAAEKLRAEAVIQAGAAERLRKEVAESLARTRTDLATAKTDLTTAEKKTTIAQGQEKIARTRAEEQTRIATERGEIATSRGLLATAQRERILGQDPFRAPLKLAVEAYRQHPSNEPDALLRYGIERNPRLVACASRDEQIESLAYGAGKQKIYALGHKAVYVLDAEHGEEQNRLTLANPNPDKLMMSDDGQTVAASYRSSPGARIDVFDTDTHAKKQPPLILNEDAAEVALSGDGRYVAALQQNQIAVLEVGKDRHDISLASMTWRLHNLTLSNDGKYLAALGQSSDKPEAELLVMWQIDNGRQVIQQERAVDCGKDNCVVGLTFSKLGAYFLAFATNNEVAVYETASGKLATTITTGMPITLITFASNAPEFLAIGDRTGFIRFYSGAFQWKDVQQWGFLVGDDVKKFDVAMIPGGLGAWSLTLTVDNTLRLWGSRPRPKGKVWEAGEEVARLPHDGRVNAMLSSAQDDKLQIVTASGNTVRLWEKTAAAIQSPLRYGSLMFWDTGYEGATWLPGITLNSRYVAAGGVGFVSVLDTLSQKVIEHDGKEAQYVPGQKIRRSVVSPDGQFMLTESKLIPAQRDEANIRANVIQVRDRLKGGEVFSSDKYSLFGSKPFSDDLRYLAVASPDGTDRRIISTRNGRALKLDGVADISFSADGNYVAETMSRYGNGAKPTPSGLVKVLKLELDRQGELRGSEETAIDAGSQVRSVLFSKRGDYLVTREKDPDQKRYVTIWNKAGKQLWSAEEGNCPLAKDDVGERCNFIAFSPDERLVAFAHWEKVSRRRTVTIYETRNMNPVRKLEREFEGWANQNGGGIVDLTFSDGGEFLAVATIGVAVDDVVSVWKVAAREEREPVARIEHALIRQIAFSEDNHRLIIVGEKQTSLTLWRTRDLLPEAERRLIAEGDCAGPPATLHSLLDWPQQNPHPVAASGLRD
jgi:WD40 repeat protein